MFNMDKINIYQKQVVKAIWKCKSCDFILTINYPQTINVHDKPKKWKEPVKCGCGGKCVLDTKVIDWAYPQIINAKLNNKLDKCFRNNELALIKESIKYFKDYAKHGDPEGHGDVCGLKIDSEKYILTEKILFKINCIIVEEWKKLK